jgi:hypothetical protein
MLFGTTLLETMTQAALLATMNPVCAIEHSYQPNLSLPCLWLKESIHMWLIPTHP